MMPGVNYVIYGGSSGGTSLGILLPELNNGGKYCCSYYSRQDDKKWQLKIKLCVLVDYSY